jgi:DNA modification methylase
LNPYFEREGFTLFFGDCREILPTLGKWSMDLLVTDPPYGMSYESNYRTGERFGKIVGDDGFLDVPGILLTAANVLRRWRHIYVFGEVTLQPPYTAQTELIWSKTSASGRGNMEIPWGKVHESIQFAVRAADKGEVSGKRGKGAARLRQGTVLECDPVPRGKMQHSTEKPVALLQRLVESSSLIGDRVFDPFAGSGSTLVAAMLEGRVATGIEIDERYAEVAATRLDRALEARRVFIGAVA